MGKTEVAKVLSRWTGGELLRLQCYEGIDAAQHASDGLDPAGDLRASPEYKKHLARVLTKRAIQQAEGK